MSVDQAAVTTRWGDELLITLFTHAGEAPSILISVIDADEGAIPTAELALAEAVELREILRKFCEQSALSHGR